MLYACLYVNSRPTAFGPLLVKPIRVVQQGTIDGLRATQMIQDKAQSAGNGRLFKDCNAVLDHLGSSLRASREAVVRGVAPLGKGAPLPARRAWRFFMPSGATTSRLAEPINSALLDHKCRTVAGGCFTRI